ncbi:cupin domain-containing protein [Noviherbaspirillum aridicola]|uniref:Cupin type-2 domain-containing protein n=1 Tax=Noviherbaspirillum aridicola TaxID=2849687 RepID=A0ABQ4Q6Z0_9BURK|nr:cupin domain-containing protein [Noviherbaspirillum aridicola]GIZ52918.1 hypothetical protein NCCP691_29320 [Noviherbaspirillum aridicola]
MYVFPTPQPEPAGLPGIRHATLAAVPHGLQRIAIWRQSLAAGAATPPHRHDCEEVVLCSAGRGTLEIDGEKHAFGPGSTLVIPPDVPHQIVNSGDEAVELLAVFSTAFVDARWPDGASIALPWQA